MKPQMAENCCQRCVHTWTDFAGMSANHSGCPNCGHNYWKWLNYREGVPFAYNTHITEGATHGYYR